MVFSILALPLHNLDQGFGAAVLALTLKHEWIAPSGAKYDFGQAMVISPSLGTPEQRTNNAGTLRAMFDNIYDRKEGPNDKCPAALIKTQE